MQTSVVTGAGRTARDINRAPPLQGPNGWVWAAFEGLKEPRDLVGVGVRVLVRSAAAYAGLRLPTGSGAALGTAGDNINAILRNLPKRARFWGQDFSADAFVGLLSGRLGEVFEKLPRTGEGGPLLTAHLQAIVAAVCAGNSTRQDGSLTLLRTSFAPYEVMESVHRLLGVRQAERLLAVQDANAVAALGLAYRGMALMERCYLCFRWAFPGQSRCELHSLASEVPGSAQEKQKRHKAAWVVCRQMGMSSFSQSPRYYSFSASDIRWTVARKLWGTTLAREQAVCEHLIEALGRSPNLRAAATNDGVDLLSTAPNRIVDELRKWLDPAESRPKVLVQEAHAAERWYRCASRALPGQRGSGRRKEDRINSALKLAGIPGATLCSVAAELSISRSTISKWFSRYPERRDVRRLHRLLVPRATTAQLREVRVSNELGGLSRR